MIPTVVKDIESKVSLLFYIVSRVDFHSNFSDTEVRDVKLFPEGSVFPNLAKRLPTCLSFNDDV